MIGKNVEKLVLLNRIAIIAIILAVLIIGTVPHTSTPNTDSRNKLDSMLASANFNTVDFTPVNIPEVPIVGETTNNENSDDANSAADLDKLLAGLVSDTSDIESMRDALLIKRNAKAAAQNSTEQNSEPTANTSSNYYSRPSNRTTSHTSGTTTTTSSSSSSSSSSRTSQPARKINYDEVVYTDDNYEAIDSGSDRKPAPAPVPVDPDTEE